MTMPSSSPPTSRASPAAMRTIVADRARMQRILDVVVAVARAQASLGLVPALATDKIAEAARAERYEPAALGAEFLVAPAAALMSALTVEVAKVDAEAARVVGSGMSEQDATDTALTLELREAIDALTADLNRAIEGFTQLAGRHRRTATVSRVGLQHTLPIPLGLKLAGYAAALSRSRERLRRLRKDALVLQFGGAAGTLAALGDRGIQVSERLAALLDLPLPDAPWHTHRDRLADIASAFAILAGTCGKIARDVALYAQTEVAEASEPTPGAPLTKRKLTAASVALSAATIAPGLLAAIVAGQVQEHEGSIGGAAAQWQAFPALLTAASDALGAVAELSLSLEIDAERMRANIDVTQGLVMAEAVTAALAAKIGRGEAARIIEEASRKALAEKRHLSIIMGEDPRVTAQMTPGELARVFELLSYQGSAQTFLERIVGAIARSARRV
jgi:3-carboxy-cis,cis-muconate cycloisomerase